MFTGATKPPEFIQGLQDQEKSEGDSVRFEVRVSGAPKPNVQWSHNGDELKNSIDIRITEEGDRRVLFIPEVFDEDAGEYTVRAENSAGVASSQTNLVIKSKGTLHGNLKNNHRLHPHLSRPQTDSIFSFYPSCLFHNVCVVHTFHVVYSAML